MSNENPTLHRYVVKFRAFSKLVVINGQPDLKALVAALNKKLSEEHQITGEVLGQHYNEEFQDFIDIEDDDEFPTGGKIQIIEKKASNSNVLCPINGNTFSSGSEGSASSGSGPSQGSSPGPSPSPSPDPSPGPKPRESFPAVYKPPAFSGELKRLLDSGVEGQRRVRNSTKLCKVMMYEIKKQLEEYGDYPNDLYALLAYRLCEHFPGLRDDSSDRTAFHQPAYKSLVAKLKTRFKYKRFSDENPSDTMKTQKVKYGRKVVRQEIVLKDIAVKRLYTRPLLKLPLNAGIGETTVTIVKHKEKLSDEWQSPAPNSEVIRDRLCRTVSDRLALYSATPEDLLQAYPLLIDSCYILLDAEICFKKKLSDLREIWFSETRLNFLVEKLSSLRALSSFPNVCKDDPRDVKMAFVMYVMPLLFREHPHHWIISTSEDYGSLLCLTATVHPGEGGSCKISGKEYPNPLKEGTAFSVRGLKDTISSNPPTIPMAVDTMVAAYYLYNVQFPSHLIRTFRFMTEEVYSFPCTKAWPQSIVSLLNQLPDEVVMEGGCTCPPDECICGGN